ncbi:DUF1697 domain-containing protein [Arthrobacter sp. I2-34]|uniref:DUF1697 domain-containing protein n=1 Tax=Arthrobacter hankyongi TaxID=2904801 RepID=A0ABS9L6R3_9MICC|nr:DUF1697 domain-containing protein [Arthrobacter hankyongi]MCG2622361.1 DUF1697 domain-containing protein [Arthrobacter hankyongi]
MTDSSATAYAVFLRGINGNGINIKMADLKRELGQLPLAGVRTLLASGNVVCSAEAPAGEVKAMVEQRLREAFGYDAWVIVLPAQRVRELVAACPYPPDADGMHTYITLGSDEALLRELFDAGAAAGAEQVLLGPEAAAWPCPKGGTLDSPLSKLGAKARYKSTTTTRNLRTMLKVLEAAGA